MTIGRQTMPAHNENIERYTPGWIGEGLATEFDLDPCSPDVEYPMKKWCVRTLSIQRGEDGLVAPWSGQFVWLNPPWQRGEKRRWMLKMAQHRHGIALVRGGVDSAWFHDCKPDAVLMLRGRVAYVRSDGEPERERKGKAEGGFEPSMLLGFGVRAINVLRLSELDGMYFESVMSRSCNASSERGRSALRDKAQLQLDF